MSKLKPSRELDALVAEHVMGCKVDRTTFLSGPHCTCPPKSGHGVSWEEQDCKGYNAILKNYSTDIAAAWEVVEKLKVGHREVRSDGCVVKDSIRIEYRETTGSWFVCWAYSGWPFMEVEYWREGESAAHAVCLAALEAVGYKEK